MKYFFVLNILHSPRTLKREHQKVKLSTQQPQVSKMASCQPVQRTRSGRATRAPTRFTDETFTKGSGVVGCDHYDHDYDNGDISGIQGFKTIEWRWNQDAEDFEKTVIDDRPDMHEEDLEGFIVSDNEEDIECSDDEDDECECDEEEYESDDETAEYDLWDSDEEEDSYEPLTRTHAIRPLISNGVVGTPGFASMVQRWSEDTGL